MISHLKIQATTQHKIIATLNKLLQVQSKSYCKRVHTAIGAPSVTEGSLATFNVSALMTQNANVIDSWLELQQVTLNWVTLLSQHYVHNMRWDSMLNPRVIFFFISIYIYISTCKFAFQVRVSYFSSLGSVCSTTQWKGVAMNPSILTSPIRNIHSQLQHVSSFINTGRSMEVAYTIILYQLYLHNVTGGKLLSSKL